VIHFGIITAPRRCPTLLDSVTSLRHAGFGYEILVCSDDASLRWVDRGCELVTNDKKLGNLRNWFKCLEILESRAQDGDWICVCEDDVTWVCGCRSALESDLRDLQESSTMREAGVLSLYFPIAMSSTLERGGAPLERGWHLASRGIKTWGAQCFLLTKQMARELMDSKLTRAYLDSPKWDKNVDGVVADVIGQRDLKILYRVPCLVNHDLGDGNSSLGYADERPKLRTRYFTGSV